MARLKDLILHLRDPNKKDIEEYQLKLLEADFLVRQIMKLFLQFKIIETKGFSVIVQPKNNCNKENNMPTVNI